MANMRIPLSSPAGHPFRRALIVDRPMRNEDQDLKLFVLSFTAFFISIYSFIC